MNKKILIIKTGSTIAALLARAEDFEDWFIAGSGMTATEFLVCSVHLRQALPPLDQISGIIITGSAAYVTELEQWNYTTADYLREAHGRKVPILGVCYGHQLVAWAFGGVVGFHAAGREIGTVEIEVTAAAAADELFRTLPKSFKAQASHQQSVTVLPPQAVLLGSNEFDPHHAFRLGECTWCVQFHPEFSAEIVATYIRERAEAIASEGLSVETLLATVTDSPEAAILLRRFACLCQGQVLAGAS